MQNLRQEADSFLILEQKDPQNPGICWYIQSAVALEGPDQGDYSVEIGFTTPGGPSLWAQMVPDVQKAAAYFSDTYHHRKVDISGFQKMEL